jgi:hypothetical protein
MTMMMMIGFLYLLFPVIIFLRNDGLVTHLMALLTAPIPVAVTKPAVRIYAHLEGSEYGPNNVSEMAVTTVCLYTNFVTRETSGKYEGRQLQR